MFDISKLHDCLSQAEFDKTFRITSAAWNKDPELRGFSAYFSSNWVNSNFNKWQIFWTDAGMSHTNSPIESFNNQIKTEFTYRIKHDIDR